MKNRIGSAIDAGKLPHALLIDGPCGSGKRTMATESAAALNCENRSEASRPLPCGECNSCRRIREGIHPDVKLLSLAKDKATIGVSEVKDLRADMFLSATESEHKVYIITDAERMTKEAQNSLLIVLEEPPKGVNIMLLATGADKLLTTIRSRAQYLTMPRLTDSEVEEAIISLSPEAARLSRVDKSSLSEIVRAADGCVGVALDMLNPASTAELKTRREVIFTLISAMRRSAPYNELYSAMTALPTKRPELSEVLEDLTDALRDMITARLDGTVRTRFFTSAEAATEMADKIGAKRLMPLSDIVLSIHEENQKNANVSALIAVMTARIRAVQ